MIKSLIILVLVIIVIGGAALSRPSEESFKAYYRQRAAQQQNQGLLDKILHESKVNDYLSRTTYKNRILWAEVEHDGKVAYTGAFSRWFPRNESPVTAPQATK